MRTTTAWATALVALAFVGSVEAHHSIMFDIGKPIWIEGTVVRFDAVNPHVLFTLERELGDGQVERWTVEGSGLRAFTLMGGDRLQPGEVVEVCRFDLKEEVRLETPAGTRAAGLGRGFTGTFS
ncbi:MAG TPA: DUF6152 family protein [Gammaproteobacteria bacterium]